MAEVWWVAIITALITAIAAILTAIVWPFIKARWRKRYFEKLIKSELAELRPFPMEAQAQDGRLQSHLNKRFVHKKIIFENPEQNPELIFSINRELLYHTNQLWSAFGRNNVNEWMKHLGKLAFPKAETPANCDPFPNDQGLKTDEDRIKKAYFEWKDVIERYVGKGNAEPQSGFKFNIPTTRFPPLTKTQESNSLKKPKPAEVEPSPLLEDEKGF